jgi:predicted metal-dependent phosphoesterase TrpH
MTAENVRDALALVNEYLIPGRRFLIVNTADLGAAVRAAVGVGGLEVLYSPAVPPGRVSIVGEGGLAAFREWAEVYEP